MPFPFSDLSQSKLRPAVVLASVGHDDWLMAQITSSGYADAAAVRLTDQDFDSGSLRRESFVRPGKLFTADHTLIIRTVGSLRAPSFQKIVEGTIEILRNSIRTRGAAC